MDGGQSDAAASLELGRGVFATRGYRSTQLGEGHVVQQQVIDTVDGKERTHLLEGVGLQLDFHLR